jgi:hypothetical protein
MNTRFPSHRVLALPFAIAVAAFGLASAASAEASAPIKLAIFEFELEDYSAGASVTRDAPADMDKLRLVTAEARRLIEQSGRYTLIDAGGADVEAVKKHSLKDCNGCEAGVAMKLGAEQSFLGIVSRLSRTEYMIRFQIRDAHSGDVVLARSTELRLGADYSWGRGAVWLINNRLLENQDRR